MSEKYPTWLTGHVKEWTEKRLPTVTLCSSTGNELLEVWYYGDLLTVKGETQSYLVDSDVAPGLVTARDPESGEEFVIFDGGRHGYDNMFCDEHDLEALEHRPLKRYPIPASKLVLELSGRNRPLSLSGGSGEGAPDSGAVGNIAAVGGCRADTGASHVLL